MMRLDVREYTTWLRVHIDNDQPLIDDGRTLTANGRDVAAIAIAAALEVNAFISFNTNTAGDYVAVKWRLRNVSTQERCVGTAALAAFVLRVLERVGERNRGERAGSQRDTNAPSGVVRRVLSVDVRPSRLRPESDYPLTPLPGFEQWVAGVQERMEDVSLRRK